MNLDALKVLPDAEKRAYRQITRKQLGAAAREYVKPMPADKRAWLSGYLDFARKALEALS